MTEKREKLLDRMIAIYGFEHTAVICFAKACGSKWIGDTSLEAIVRIHEAARRI